MAEAGNANKRRKQKRKRQLRFCRGVADRLALIGADYCQQTYQFSTPAVIPACIAAYDACLPYTRACQTSAAQGCYAAFHDVW